MTNPIDLDTLRAGIARRRTVEITDGTVVVRSLTRAELTWCRTESAGDGARMDALILLKGWDQPSLDSVEDPLDLLENGLTAGDFRRLVGEVLEVSGLTEDARFPGGTDDDE